MVNSSSTTMSGSLTTKRPRSPEPPSQAKIRLLVKNQQDGQEDVFRIRVHVPLKRLMSAYCEKRNLDYRTVRFLFNGDLLNARQTPAQLMMEDKDLIDMFMEAPGGGPFTLVA